MFLLQEVTLQWWWAACTSSLTHWTPGKCVSIGTVITCIGKSCACALALVFPPLSQDSDEVGRRAGQSWVSDFLRERSGGPGEAGGDAETGEVHAVPCPDEERQPEHQLCYCGAAADPHCPVWAYKDTWLWSGPAMWVCVSALTFLFFFSTLFAFPFE